jgi:uncharacterized protein
VDQTGVSKRLKRGSEKRQVGMRCVIVLLALAIMVTSGVVIGASFNCSKAGNSVEKTICASQVLSKLDEQLAEAYSSAIHVSDNPDSLKRQQQEWLRNVRDQCQDESCLKGVYENWLAQLGEAKQINWQRFRDAHIGIEFSYPSNRKVEVGCRGSRNCIAVIGKPMPNSDYLMALEVFDGDLETVAEDKAVFEKKNDGWIAKGRFGEHPVVPLARLQVHSGLWNYG